MFNLVYLVSELVFYILDCDNSTYWLLVLRLLFVVIMAVRIDKITVDKLEGDSNWISWKFDINLQLTLHKVTGYVTGTEPVPDAIKLSEIRVYEEKESIARYIIGSTVGKDAKQHILTCKTAKEMWDALHAVYEQKNERRLDLLYCELFTYKKSVQDSIALHVSKLQQIFGQLNNELKNENAKLPESLLLNRILNTLPTEYLEFKNAWESVPCGNRSVSVLMERLRMHEQRLQDMVKVETDVALVAKENVAKKPAICNFCKKKGHIKKNCYKLKNKSSTKKDESKDTRGQAFMAGDSLCDSTDWIIDSGASHHITSHREWFSEYEAFKEEIPLKISDGSNMMAHGAGTILVEMNIYDKWEIGYLKDVWYVPMCSQNLFSSGSALKNGLVEIANEKRRIFKNKNGEIKAIGIKGNSTLYKLLIKVVRPKGACNYVDLQTWHERLCHQNIRHLENFLKTRGIETSPSRKELCDGCMYGKMTKLPFHIREVRATTPAQIIHADVCGPIQEKSVSGSLYFVVFKDDYTKYRKVYFLKEKSEVKNVTSTYLEGVKTCGYRVQELMTDGGKEFVNSEMQKILNAHGVKHRVTMPYSPQQNGAAERENRILIEAARSMLHAKNMEKRLWAEAVNTAAYVLNRTGPTGVDNVSTPFGLWHGREPDISHLRIFGTKCFVHIPDQKRRKLDKKAVKGVLVGYSGDKDGYRIWSENGQLILSRNVKFLSEETCINIFSNESNNLLEEKQTLEASELTELIDKSISGDDTDAHPIAGSSSDVNELLTQGDQSSGDVEFFDSVANDSPLNLTSMSDDNASDSDSVAQKRYPLRNRKPRVFPDYHIYYAESNDECNINFKTLNDLPECWKQAVQDELLSLSENNTWSIVDLPSDVTPIDSKWVFKVKRNADGNLVKYKARLVARGFHQKYGIDYFDTYSPVVRTSTLRILFSLAVQFDWFIEHWDVVTAFLHGTLNEDVYMYLPKGLTDDTKHNDVNKDMCNKVCKLNKALYGLKQAASSWNQEIHKALLTLGFFQSKHESCVYTLKHEKMYFIIAIYVDDIFVFGNDKNKKTEIYKSLLNKFKLKDLGPIEYALSLRVYRKESIMYVDQKKYIQKVLDTYGMIECKPSQTVMPPGVKLSKGDTPDPHIPYQNLIGSLMYVAVHTRSDILHAVTVLSQFNNCYTKEHFVHAKHVLRYLKGTLNYCVVYKKSSRFNLYGYVDADWANSDDRKSYSGLLFKLGNNVVSYQSKKQTCISLSSTEAEYVALSEGAKEAIFLKKLIKELYVEMSNDPIVIYNDNQSCHKIACNKTNSKRTKHIDVKFHYIREAVLLKNIIIKFVPTDKMVADIFTKLLNSIKIKNFVQQLSLYCKD